MIDLDLLRLYAVKTGLGLKYLAKEERISVLLKQLPNLFADDSIILKGGTAFNRGYLVETKKTRFSEDIDLDFVSSDSLDEKIKQITKTMRNIEEFTVSSPRLLHRTMRFDCRYTNQLNERDRVQVEFYLNQKTPARPPQKELLQSFYVPMQATMFMLYSLEDLIAQKLISLYRRSEGKDIYDLFYGLDLSFDHDLISKSLTHLFVHYHIAGDQKMFFTSLLEKIDELEGNARYIGNETNLFLPKNLRPDWTVFIRGLKEKVRHHFT